MNTTESKEELILHAALELFVENGFHGTPTSQIAKTAGVSNGTLFHYFPSKDILINRLYLSVKESMISHTIADIDTRTTVKSKLALVWQNMIYWVKNHHNEFYFVQQFTFSPFLNQVTIDTVNEHKKVFEELIHNGIKEGIIKDLPEGLLVFITNSILNGYLDYIEKSSVDLNDEHIEIGFNLLWDAIKK